MSNDNQLTPPHWEDSPPEDGASGGPQPTTPDAELALEVELAGRLTRPRGTSPRPSTHRSEQDPGQGGGGPGGREAPAGDRAAQPTAGALSRPQDAPPTGTTAPDPWTGVFGGPTHPAPSPTDPAAAPTGSSNAPAVPEQGANPPRPTDPAPPSPAWARTANGAPAAPLRGAPAAGTGAPSGRPLTGRAPANKSLTDKGGEKATKAGLKAAASSLGGPAGAALVNNPIGDKVVGKVAEVAWPKAKAAIKNAAITALAPIVIKVVLVLLLIGGTAAAAAAIIGAGAGNGHPLPDEPTTQQRVMLPPGTSPATDPGADHSDLTVTATPVSELVDKYGDVPGWADVAYLAQESSVEESYGVPWTVFAGIARTVTDFGRRSPYDTIDRTLTRDPVYGHGPGSEGSSGIQVAASSFAGTITVAGDETAAAVAAGLTGKIANQVTASSVPDATLDEVVDAVIAQTELPDAVYVLAGSHEPDGDPERLAKQFSRLAAAAESTTFYLATVHRPGKPGLSGAYNAAVDAAAAANPNVKKLPWASLVAKKPNWAPADGDLTPGGLSALTRLVKQSAEALTSTSGWVFPLPQGTYRKGTWFGKEGSVWSSGYHTGQDFPAATGTPVAAARAGTVTVRTDQSWAGSNFVIIDHGPADGAAAGTRLYTWYAHMESATVTSGQAVRAGQQIGTVGNRGNSYGSHLHLEVRLGSNPVDPLKYVTVHPGTAVSSEDLDGGDNDCAVRSPEPAIGGGDGQGVGPFLLMPEHAEKMTDAGEDPQNPCQAAAYVGRALGQMLGDPDTAGNLIAGLDMERDDWVEDEKLAELFWSAVVSRSGLLVDPSTGKTDCDAYVDGPGTIAAAISTIWSCEAARTDLRVLERHEDSPEKFAEVTGSAAGELLAQEATTVAWNFSQFDDATCDLADPRAGIFPLTADAAAEAGVSDRCDAVENIRGAAQLVMSGETQSAGSRPTGKGPFQPMLGGWAKIPWALGNDPGLFAAAGPPARWNPDRSCSSAIEAWVAQKTDALATTIDTATAAGMSAADAAQVRSSFGEGPRTQCAAASVTAGDWATKVALTAQALGETATGYAPSEDQALSPWETTGGFESPIELPVDPATAPDPVPSATAAGARFQAVADAFSLTPVPAVPSAQKGKHSLISRLSVQERRIPRPEAVTAAGAEQVAYPLGDLVVEYAIGYGGIAPDYDTTITDAATLQEFLAGSSVPTSIAVSGTSASAAAVMAAARTQIGLPYSWGGGSISGPTLGVAQGASTKGFDCSSLMMYAFHQVGITLPRTSSAQATVGSEVNGGLANAKAGDLLFWSNAGGVYHVAMYIGEGRMLEAPRTGSFIHETAVYRTSEISHVRRVLPETAAVGVGYTPDTAAEKRLASALTKVGGQSYTGLFVAAGTKHKIDPALLAAVAMQESSFSPAVVNCTHTSSAGARGIMQFMPATAQSWQADPCDPASAVDGGARYLNYLWKRLGSMERALGGYNWGEGNVMSRGLGAAPAETRNYIAEVPQYCREFGGCQG